MISVIYYLRKKNIRLRHVLQIPDEIICHNYNNIKAGDTEALRILLRHLCYPARFSDLILRFFRPVPQTLCDTRPISNLLKTLDLTWLSRCNLTLFTMGLFWAAHGWGRGAKRPTLPKTCRTYRTMTKLGSYTLLKKDPKIYVSSDATLEFC